MGLINKWNREFFDTLWNKCVPEGVTFDDVLIIPQRSNVVPRDVNLESRLTARIPLHMPLVSADMDTVTEYQTAIVMAMLGGIGFLHRNADIETQAKWVGRVKYAINARIDKPVTVQEEQTYADVQRILDKYERKFSTLVVLNSEGKVVGLVSSDLTRFVQDPSTKVMDFMRKDPITCRDDLDVKAAYEYMRLHKAAKLILVKPDGGLKGLYCWKDVKEIVEKTTPMFNRDENGQLRVGANVGVHDYERAEAMLKRKCDVLLVGTAHGHTENVIDTVKELRSNFSRYTFDIVAGNVATYEGAEDLFNAGADAVKVGIGPGSICTTRIISGVGVPQLTAIYLAAKAAEDCGRHIIADGGIRYSGDIPKALAAGASSVMMGGLLAGTKEAPGELIYIGGKRVKVYRGMGSEGAMANSMQARERYNQGDELPEKLVPEGVEAAVPYRGMLTDVLHNLLGGLRAEMGYVGAENIAALHERTKFSKVSPASQVESHPHNITITKEAPNY